MDGRYIILEIIPEAVSPDKGSLVQLSAIKLNGLVLEDRLDCRLDESKIKIKDLLSVIDYDKDSFKYFNSTEEILDEFKNWSEGLTLLILDNDYTKNYLNSLDNEKTSIADVLGLEYNDNIINDIMDKYNLVPTPYIVDILYEALIYKDDNKNT